jgi:preprotein translocase subunit SecB
LQLEALFTNELSFKVNRNHSPQAGAWKSDISGMSLQCQVGIDPTQARRGFIKLTFDLPDKEGNDVPFTFHFTVEGFFSVHESQEANFEKLLQMAGVPMLYSTARQVLRSATSLSMFPPAFLPTVSFLDVKEEEEPLKALRVERSAKVAAGKGKPFRGKPIEKPHKPAAEEA